MALRILLADDHRMVLDGLRQLIEQQASMQVVAEATNGDEAYHAWKQAKPDISVIDISMPILSGLDLARRILGEQPKAKLLVLSMHSDPRYVRQALKIGVRGYIVKEEASEELIRAIRTVHAGNLFISRSLGDTLLEDFVSLLKHGSDGSGSVLSERERQVLGCLADGCSTKEIATMLHVSVKTVESHRTHIMEKLDLHSIAELTKYAIREGLTDLG